MSRLLLTALSSFAGVAHSLAAPVNDNFSSASPLGSAITASATGTLEDATSQGADGEPDLSDIAMWELADDRTVWYEWTAPPGTTWAQVTVDGTNLANRLSVYTGDGLDSLDRMRLNDKKAASKPNRSTFPVTPGTKYFIRIGAEELAVWELPWNEEPVYNFGLSLKAITSPSAAADYVLRGRGRLEQATSAAMIEAREDFAAAVAADATHNEARFLLGLSQLFALEGETAFITLLDRLGIPISGSFRGSGYKIPVDVDGLPALAEGADSGAVFAWLGNEVLPRLGLVRSALGGISGAGFRTGLTESEAGWEFSVDTGDALALKAGTHAVELLIHLLTTYNLSTSLEGLADLDRAGELNAERVLEIYESLLRFSEPDRRAGLAAALEALESDYRLASDFIRNQRVSAEGLVTEALSLDRELDGEIRSRLAQAVEALDRETEIGGRRVNLSAFLTSTASLRDWLPGFKGNHVAGDLPDPTFGGSLPNNTNAEVKARLYELGQLWGMSQYAAEVGDWLKFLGLDGGPDDDADSDGRNNFAEWVFGSDPAAADTVYQEIIPPDNAHGDLKFSFIRASNLRDWVLVVLVSDDLLTWDDTELTVQPAGDPAPNGDGFTETVTYKLIAPDGLPPRKFFRVEARPKS